MADVKPLRGIRYPFEKLSSAAAKNKLAPPYDVIDEVEQDELYERDPENIIRIILNRRTEADGDSNNRYTRARRYLMDWLADGVLTRDNEPQIYFHEQDFDGTSSERHIRKGFLARLSLEDYENKVVLPHEYTHEGPKIDRLNMMKACECNVSPIFLLYDDPSREIEEAIAKRIDEPMLDIKTPSDGIEHRLWGISDPDIHRRIEDVLAGKSVLIADGHHRYETALAYRNFRREIAEEHREEAPYEHVLAFFVNMRHPGLKIFPTHRILNGVSSFSARAFEQKLNEIDGVTGEVLETESLDEPELLVDRVESESSAAFVFGVESTPVLATVRKDVLNGQDQLPGSVSKLDAAILHEYLIPRLFEDFDDLEENVRYDRNTRRVADIHRTENSPVVFMAAPTIDDVVEVCRSGGRMPQKSTYFYPKILSGLVLNPV